MKQASQNWYKKFTNALLKLEFTQSKADHSLFIQHQGKSPVAALIYVDDVIVMGNDTQKIKERRRKLTEDLAYRILEMSSTFMELKLLAPHKVWF